MKYLVISDLHGSKSALKINQLLKKGNFDKVILLGDILYHGPRNDVPKDYDPKLLIKNLNAIKDKIIAVKGNCDAYVDEMVLEFKLEDYIDMKINSLNAHLEHGHFINDYKNDGKNLIMYGHTHITRLDKIDGIIYFNPGSISIPKEHEEKCYGVIDEEKITIYNIEDKIIKELKYR